MRNDDEQVGRILTRREAVALLGVTGAAFLAGCSRSEASNGGVAQTADAGNAGAPNASAAAVPGCVVRPAQTEGPYFVDEKLNRSDIRSDPSDGSVKPGTPLELSFNVSHIANGACAPLAGALVDIWHCDADGVYSDVQDPHFNTKGKKFLRGYQTTDQSGQVKFATIYPGWYEGRTVHIHFTVRTAPAGPGHEFTSQIYFDDALNDKVFSRPPYAARGNHKSKNTDDEIFRDGGSQLVLAAKPATSGYAGTFDIALNTG